MGDFAAAQRDEASGYFGISGCWRRPAYAHNIRRDNAGADSDSRAICAQLTTGRDSRYEGKLDWGRKALSTKRNTHRNDGRLDLSSQA